jgi:hypothetical protein
LQAGFELQHELEQVRHCYLSSHALFWLLHMPFQLLLLLLPLLAGRPELVHHPSQEGGLPGSLCKL